LNLQEEIIEIFGYLKNRMDAYHDIGLDPPHLSSEDMDYPEPISKGMKHNSDPQKSPETLEDLRTLIGECKRCKLHEKRTKLVFGDGSSKAKDLYNFFL